MNSASRRSPCFARQSATWLVSLPLWIIDKLGHVFLEFLMKFSGKAKFQGPPDSSRHHLTALAESDSMMMFAPLIDSLLREILIARRIANISAELISILGIGLEKRAMKRWSAPLKTPPTAAWLKRLSNDASTFHLTHPMGGGPHDFGEITECSGFFDLRMPIGCHWRQHGFRTISSAEKGNGSFQPLIHHPNRRRIRSEFQIEKMIYRQILEHFFPSRLTKWLWRKWHSTLFQRIGHVFFGVSIEKKLL